MIYGSMRAPIYDYLRKSGLYKNKHPINQTLSKNLNIKLKNFRSFNHGQNMCRLLSVLA